MCNGAQLHAHGDVQFTLQLLLLDPEYTPSSGSTCVLLCTASICCCHADDINIRALQMRRRVCKQAMLEGADLGIGKELFHEVGMQVHIPQLVGFRRKLSYNI